jgi:hypothetical protein
MLFSQIERLAWQEEIISLIKVGQLCGHSCFRIETKTKFSLFKKARSVRSFSSELEFSMMKLTMKFRIPVDKIAQDQRALLSTFISGTF